VRIIEKLKNKIGFYYLRKESLKYRKNKQTVNINDAKSIGIIYKVTDENLNKEVVGFIKLLQNKNIDVYGLGFVDYKNIPHYCYPSLKHIFISKNKINWYYKAKGNEINDFISKDFDILIDLTMDLYLPGQFILSQSNARFIVGKYHENTEHYYDMMLKVDSGISIKDYINSIVDYLKIIKEQKKCIPFIKQLELL